MAGLTFVDNRVIVPALRTGAPDTGDITDMTITDSGVRFTEVIDVGTFKELILFCDVTTFTAGTLDAILQISGDGKKFVDFSGESLTQVTGGGLTYKRFSTNFGKYIRFKITLGAGTNMVVSMYLACKG